MTFVFLQEGDIDSAFATMFEAINEDKESKDPILGEGAYKTSPERPAERSEREGRSEKMYPKI